MKIVKYFRQTIGLVLLYPFISYAGCNSYKLNNSIDGEQLWRDFSYLAADDMQGRKTESAGSALAQAFLVKRFTEINLQSFSEAQKYRMPFRYELTFSHVDGVNLAGYLLGKTYPHKFIVISAHYDHIGMRGRQIYNGADDNASGVSAMLAIAEKLAQIGSAYSIIFLATDAEEKGLYGSKAFVERPPVELSQIQYNLNLDMLSQNQGKNRLYVSGARYHEEFKPIVDQAIAQAGLCLVNQHRRNQRGYSVLNGADWRKASDHASFAEVGIPYLFIGVSDHNYYHTEKDTVDRVDPEFFQAAVETSFSILKMIDKLPERSTDEKQLVK